ncbi:hypothetical protein [Chitinophaga sancti]|uniref:Restriction endonuclease n=1 Tax=Chitinophaga sancti TaxID=1004 RepID=A0A1K1T389_9BACT|nr:hypothetical protein [Chitinophaga sancti]WQD61432.1 hypothetical protein U0033_26505 [Chitinophaga sancti]WQD61772.1 hypothetical protein U0033_28220 [Chitinophaga sancti]WQG92659.1 hypothetical protein SR876_14165 [Chitinophaga sancti]WQG93015.1 hypothetical protein SR876_15955 [Chitinophaga sancti]SFW90982.1 hypothetical protein SAMN05661012_06709 [Chitinophaga sancti]
MSANFHQDLLLGRTIESQLATIFEAAGYTTINTRDKEDFPDYDLIVTHPDGTTSTVEVKYDKMASQTGNAAVEYQKLKDNKIIPSGIFVCKADFIAYKFTNDTNFYFIPPADLKSLINKKKYSRTVNGGDDKRSVLALFNLSYFKSQCEKVNLQVLKSIG